MAESTFQALTAATVPALWQERHTLFKEDSVDLGSLKEVDSAGIAFLVQWAKALPQGYLTLVNAPEAALKLVATFRLEDLLHKTDA